MAVQLCTTAWQSACRHRLLHQHRCLQPGSGFRAAAAEGVLWSPHDVFMKRRYDKLVGMFSTKKLPAFSDMMDCQAPQLV